MVMAMAITTLLALSQSCYRLYQLFYLGSSIISTVLLDFSMIGCRREPGGIHKLRILYFGYVAVL